MRNRRRTFALAGMALLISAAAPPDTPAGARHHPSAGGLSAVIRYTEYGIPHIVAKDYPNLGFGEGWAQAADQVCTLADGFVTLRGERSRYFGADAAPDQSLSSAATNLSSDLYFAGVRRAGTVEKLLRQPAPTGPSHTVKDLMRGWAAGYNAWLSRHRTEDPACAGKPWVRPVSSLDVARRAFALAVLGGQGRVVDGITAAAPPGTRPVSDDRSVRGGDGATGKGAVDAVRRLFSQDGSDMGSNAVAFKGSTTANGRGLLLGNPHYPWSGGRRFWQSQVTIPGELNASGGSLLGSVTVSIGHNAEVAWSHTVATGVTLNLHQLTLDPSDPTSYLVDGVPHKMTRRLVTVPVKDGPDVSRVQWWTRYGPVVSSLGQLQLPWTGGTAFAVNDPNAVNLRAADTALRFSKATGVDGIARSLRDTQGLPWTNTIAADARPLLLQPVAGAPPHHRRPRPALLHGPRPHHLSVHRPRGTGRLPLRLRPRAGSGRAATGRLRAVRDAHAEGRALRRELQRQRLADQRRPASHRISEGLRRDGNPALAADPWGPPGRLGDGGARRADP